MAEWGGNIERAPPADQVAFGKAARRVGRAVAAGRRPPRPGANLSTRPKAKDVASICSGQEVGAAHRSPGTPSYAFGPPNYTYVPILPVAEILPEIGIRAKLLVKLTRGFA